MITKKAGTILLNLENKQVGLVYRKTKDDYSFPKGHLEENESLAECAIRETEEETSRSNHLLIANEIHVQKYVTPAGENVENYTYIAIDDGPTTKDIPIKDQEILEWINFEDVEEKLSYDTLKELWRFKKEAIKEIFESNGSLTAAILTDLGICPTCYNKENNEILYGDNSSKILYEDEHLECFLVGNPRAPGHTAISSKKHYKDMMEIPDDLCKEIFIFAKKVMNILKEIYGSESVYLCTMCDGPMNHFHIQLIPRYENEKRGSKNFVKPRMEYVEDKEKINEIRNRLKTISIYKF